jgi:hypothetical protein
VDIDVGGTKILGGVVDPFLRCKGIAKISTKPERGAGVVVERIVHCVRAA